MLKNSIKTVTAIIVMLTILIVVTGCAKTNNKANGKMTYIGFKVYDPVYVAKDMGFFEKHNVDLEISDAIAGGSNAIQMIAGGNAEAGIAAYMATINATVSGLKVKAVSDIQSAIGKQALEEFFVRSDSGINSVSDLKGKTIAINIVKASFHYTWLMALKDVGLEESDVNFIILPFDQQELALANGQVDAIGLMQPYVLHAKENTEIKLLYTALDIFGQKQFCTHVINSEWAEKNPAIAEGFVAAIAEAGAWIEENQVEAKEIISRYTGVEVKYIEDYHFQPKVSVNMDDAQYWLDYMQGRGDVNADGVKVEDFATNKYNPYMKSEKK